MSLLRYSKRRIPTPEWTGIGSTESKAAINLVEMLQTVTQKMEQYLSSKIINHMF